MKRLKVVIPVMIVVAILSAWMLERDHSAVPIQARVFIILGGTIVSGVITYFLLQPDSENVGPKHIGD